MRKIIWSLSVVIIIVLLGILTCNLAVRYGNASRLYTDIDAVPKNKVGLVLGTSKYLTDGQENLYFKYRMQAAAQLYKAGRIDYIIVSGDNSVANYNEPRMMKKELVKMGIPSERIHLDYAGFRTLDSVVRCREIFGQEKFTIISQRFHNERALFIARGRGIDAVAYNAKDVGLQSGFKTMLREVLARVKVVSDLYIFDTQPRFLGEKIEI